MFQDWRDLLVEIGARSFCETIYPVLTMRAQLDEAGRYFLVRVFSIDESVAFDYRSFLYRARRYNPQFDMTLFLHELALYSDPVDSDGVLMDLLSACGWLNINRQDYSSAMRELCGNFDLRFKVIVELQAFLKAQSPRHFIDYIYLWIEEYELSDAVVKVYTGCFLMSSPCLQLSRLMTYNSTSMNSLSIVKHTMSCLNFRNSFRFSGCK